MWQLSLINVHNSSPNFYSTSICLTIEQVTCRLSRSFMCYSIKTSMKYHLFSFSLAYVQHFSHNTQHADPVGWDPLGTTVHYSHTCWFRYLIELYIFYVSHLILYVKTNLNLKYSKVCDGRQMAACSYDNSDW